MSANENKNNDCVKIGDFNVGEITIGGKKDDKKTKKMVVEKSAKVS